MMSSMVIRNGLGLRELKTTKFRGYKNNVRLGSGLVYELLSRGELAGQLLLIWWRCVTVKFVVLGFSGHSVKFSLRSRNILQRETWLRGSVL